MTLDPVQGGWQRLDPRMLVVQPVLELRRFLPVVIGAALAGGVARGGGLGWELLAVAVPVALGVARYVTTRYRVREGRVELRQGLLQKTLRTAQLDRVRTVDLTSSLVHRILGLSTVRIGTGAADQDLELDGLRTANAQQLRIALLERALPAETEPTPGNEAAVQERIVLRLDPAWARYAPLTSTGVLAAAALLGVVTQVAPDSAWRLDRLPELAQPGWGWVVLVGLAVVTAALGSAVLAVLGYLMTYWGLVLARTPTQWRMTRGLLTTRETTVEEARMAGVVIRQSLGLRLSGAADLGAIVTGLGGQDSGGLTLVPPAPAVRVTAVAAEVLGTPLPAYADLRTHGAAARRRRWVRALTPMLVLVAVVAATVGVVDLSALWLLPAVLLVLPAAALAHDRARGLGHVLVEGHLVARSGSLLRRREHLSTGHIIGWTLRDSWFQRRQGLVTLEATTAGGRQRVTVLDVPEDVALALSAEATPGLFAEIGYRTPASR